MDIAHQTILERNYRYQRHIYDLTRKPYLLGRTAVIERLGLPPGGAALEIGCGTGRNLVHMAHRYPDARLFGIDLSQLMLESARRSVSRRGLAGHIRLAHGDATSFDAGDLFGQDRFDRIVMSYSLSMMPPWRQAIAHAARHLAPAGELHVVDFGDMAGWPALFRRGMRAWLARFHVEPRDDLHRVLDNQALGVNGALHIERIYRGYAQIAVLRAQAGGSPIAAR